MIQLCVFPDACPDRYRIRTETSGFDSVSADEATVAVALNGQQFATSSTIYYLYDDSDLYFKPAKLSPIIGPTDGGTQVILSVSGSSFPLVDIESLYEYQQDESDDTPIDSVIVRFKSKTSEYIEFVEGMLVSDDLAKDNIVYADSPPLREGQYQVSVSVNGQNYWPSNETAYQCQYVPAGLNLNLGGYCVKAGCVTDDVPAYL